MQAQTPFIKQTQPTTNIKQRSEEEEKIKVIAQQSPKNSPFHGRLRNRLQTVNDHKNNNNSNNAKEATLSKCSKLNLRYVRKQSTPHLLPLRNINNSSNINKNSLKVFEIKKIPF